MGNGFKIGSAAVALVIVAGLIGLYSYLNSKIDDLEREKLRLERQIVTIDAEKDSLLGLGEYVITDTLWDSIPVPYPVHDTLPPDTFFVPWPRIRGHITIDTFKTFGPDYDPLSVKVTGKFYFPEQKPDTNWLKIVPSFRSAPNLPVTRSQKSVGIGLNYLRAFNQHDYFGVSVRYKRFTVIGSYDPWRKSLIAGLNYEILRF